jgi:uncharacterized membrane protein YhaH (DUF805 family)
MGLSRQFQFALLQHRGRIGRLRYIAFTLVLAVALLLTVLVGGLIKHHVGSTAGLLVGGALYVATVFLSANLAAKRLHDLGLPGWHYLWVFALGFFAEGWLKNERLQIVALAAYALVLAFSIFLSAWPGNKGSNRYGEPPA